MNRFEDEATDSEGTREGDPGPGQIGLPGLEYSLGCGSLKVSIETQNLNHARYLYDQLVPLTPILMALSAASPIYKGQLTNQDHRWDVFAR